jgi:hypothetical protein
MELGRDFIEAIRALVEERVIVKSYPDEDILIHEGVFSTIKVKENVKNVNVQTPTSFVKLVQASQEKYGDSDVIARQIDGRTVIEASREWLDDNPVVYCTLADKFSPLPINTEWMPLKDAISKIKSIYKDDKARASLCEAISRISFAETRSTREEGGKTYVDVHYEGGADSVIAINTISLTRESIFGIDKIDEITVDFIEDKESKPRVRLTAASNPIKEAEFLDLVRDKIVVAIKINQGV